jgi:hypothetical protein
MIGGENRIADKSFSAHLQKKISSMLSFASIATPTCGTFVSQKPLVRFLKSQSI